MHRIRLLAKDFERDQLETFAFIARTLPPHQNINRGIPPPLPSEDPFPPLPSPSPEPQSHPPNTSHHKTHSPLSRKHHRHGIVEIIFRLKRHPLYYSHHPPSTTPPASTQTPFISHRPPSMHTLLNMTPYFIRSGFPPNFPPKQIPNKNDNNNKTSPHHDEVSVPPPEAQKIDKQNTKSQYPSLPPPFPPFPSVLLLFPIPP